MGNIDSTACPTWNSLCFRKRGFSAYPLRLNYKEFRIPIFLETIHLYLYVQIKRKLAWSTRNECVDGS